MPNSRIKRRMAVLHANRVKEAENIHWNDVYKLPLHADHHVSFAWTPDGTMALDFDFDVEMKVREEIIAIINGKKESDTKGRWYVANAINFFLDGLYVFCVRGWGHLTGTGPTAMHLPEESAIRIQDEFVKYILYRLN